MATGEKVAVSLTPLAPNAHDAPVRQGVGTGLLTARPPGRRRERQPGFFVVLGLFAATAICMLLARAPLDPVAWLSALAFVGSLTLLAHKVRFALAQLRREQGALREQLASARASLNLAHNQLEQSKQAQASYERDADQLRSAGLAAGSVAHDFNNLLTTILGNVALLQTRTQQDDTSTLLAELEHSAQQAANLTKQLLALSRQQLMDAAPADVTVVVNQARSLFERVLGPRHRLVLRLPSEPCRVRADATQLEQALLNLLLNAKHAMPEGGAVTLDVQEVTLRMDANWPDAEPGAYVRIAVSDTGTGMDAATCSRVFEPFFTTKRDGHGTGLGLSGVQQLVRQARGHIRLVSQPGQGTRVELVLPSHPPQAARLTAQQLGADQPLPTVLLVDDQAIVRQSLTSLLEDAGYRVLAVESAEQALAVTQQRGLMIDVLISDVVMPGQGGLELSRQLRLLHPDLAVVLMSGYGSSDVELHDEPTGRTRFLQKPFDVASLLATTRDALAQTRAATAPTQKARTSAHA